MCRPTLGLFPRFRFRARLGSSIIPFPASPHQTVRDLFDHTAFRQLFIRRHARHSLASSTDQVVLFPQSAMFVPPRRTYAFGTKSAFRVHKIGVWKSAAGCPRFENSWTIPSLPGLRSSPNLPSKTEVVLGPPLSASPSRRFSSWPSDSPNSDNRSFPIFSTASLLESGTPGSQNLPSSFPFLPAVSFQGAVRALGVPSIP